MILSGFRQIFNRLHVLNRCNYKLNVIKKYITVVPQCKGEAVPLRSIEAHLGDRRYSSYSFLTSALEGGEWSASGPGRALPPGKEPPVPVVQEAGWALEPVWTQRLEGKSSASVWDRTPAVQSVVRHYTDWASRLLYRSVSAIKIFTRPREVSNREESVRKILVSYDKLALELWSVPVRC
jgi:hypothetical protein